MEQSKDTFETSDYTLSHVVAASPGWSLVYVEGHDAGKKMRLVPIAAFTFGTERRYVVRAGERRIKKLYPATGVLAPYDGGCSLSSHIEWLGGDYDWLFESRIAGIVGPGQAPEPVYEEAVRDLEKYQERDLEKYLEKEGAK